MTPITREQARELADRHHGKSPLSSGEFCWLISESELEALLNDAIASLQAKLEEMARVQEFTSKTADAALAKLEQSEARARWAYESAMRQLVSPTMSYEQWCANIDAALNKEPGHEA